LIEDQTRKKGLGAKSETETIQRALDLAITETA
jgi:hypothetical protein